MQYRSHVRNKFSHKLFIKTYINKHTKQIVCPLFCRVDFVDFKRNHKGYIVYKIHNKITNLCYIGFTSHTIKQRWQRHYKNAVLYNGKSKFYDAIQQFSDVRDWHLEELDHFDNAFFAKVAEIYYIDKFDSYKNGYNSTMGGDGIIGHHAPSPKKGKKNIISEESRKRMSEAGKNRAKISEETRDKMSKSRTGRKHSQETIEKLKYKASNRTKESLENINKSKRKQVCQYDLDMNFIAEFESITIAIQKTGILNVSGCCRLKNKQAGGFIWRYKYDKK